MLLRLILSGVKMRIISIILANALIFLSTLKDTILFFLCLRNFKQVQFKKFNRLISNNWRTSFFKSKHDAPVVASKLSLTTWDDYQPYIKQILKGKPNVLTTEKVLLLEPTSGTTSATKYVPYTKSLKKEFTTAIKPWLAGLYLTWPKLLCCTQYWSVSPAGHAQDFIMDVPVGFEQDSEYLGGRLSSVQNSIMAVPASVQNVSDSETWAYITAFYLLRDNKLGLISVWHPSFLTILIKKIKDNYTSLVSDIKRGRISIEPRFLKGFSAHVTSPKPRRAKQLGSYDIHAHGIFEKIWPFLQIISCWADFPDEPCLKQLKKLFPKTYFQPKGLIATESIISFPFGRRLGIPAYRSHYLEFIDARNGKLKNLHQLDVGQKYEVVLTTGGGLYRYILSDIVQVTGVLKNRLPLLRFIGKSNYVTDIRGEKVSLQQVDDIFNVVYQIYDGIKFLMLAPVVEQSRAFYSCFINVDNPADFPFGNLAADIEMALKNNYHYRYARELSQLEEVRIFLSPQNPIQDIVSHLESKGTKKGDIKILPLSNISDWHTILRGKLL